MRGRQASARCTGSRHGLTSTTSKRWSSPESPGRDCTKAAALDPKYATAYENPAWARERLGDTKGLLEDYTRLLDLDPANPARHAKRGRLRAQLDDPAGALEDLGKALELNPSLKDELAPLVEDCKKRLAKE